MSFFFKKRPQFRIAVLGAGKVAGHLAPALEDAGHQVVAVYSRRPGPAEQILQHLYEAEAVHDTDFTGSSAEVFILAVSDDAIEQLSENLRLPPEVMLLHTSGGRSMEVLQRADTSRRGVLYPLQTFSEGQPVNFKQVPILVEADNEANLKQVRRLAESLSDHVLEVASAQRQLLHTAAVFACNFTNHMMHLAEEIVEDQGISFELLKPLIQETLEKAMHSRPSDAQTGPAVRNDHQTMAEHLRLLRNLDPEVAELYQLISHSIQQHHR